MKAAIIKDYGQNAIITDIPLRKLPHDSVVVEVYASSVNPIDNLLRSGALKAVVPIPFPFTLGNDVSGVVVDTGKSVSGFKPGDAVFSRPNPAQSGTFAEQVVVKAEDLALKPANLSHTEAASIPLVALTSLQALVTKANLQPGQKVLIHAGSGGVGTAAIQLAKHLGAGEIATTTSTGNIEMVKALGADVVIDYKGQKFEDIVSDYDVVFDTIGGQTRNKSFGVLKEGGMLVSIVGMPDSEGLAGKHNVRFEQFFMWASGEQLSQIAKLVESGTIKPVIDRSYPLDEVQEALDYSQSGRAKGKIVIAVK